MYENPIYMEAIRSVPTHVHPNFAMHHHHVDYSTCSYRLRMRILDFLRNAIRHVATQNLEITYTCSDWFVYFDIHLEFLSLRRKRDGCLESDVYRHFSIQLFSKSRNPYIVY